MDRPPLRVRQSPVEFGPFGSGAIDPLGQKVCGRVDLPAQLGDRMTAVIENLHEGADADGKQERDDQRGDGAP